MVVMGLSSVIPDGYNAMGLLSVIRNGCNALSFVIPDGGNGAVVYYTRLLQGYCRLYPKWIKWYCRLLYQMDAVILSEATFSVIIRNNSRSTEP